MSDLPDDDAVDDKDKKQKEEAKNSLEGTSEGKSLERHPSVRKKLRALAFGNHRKGLSSKETSKKRKSSWASKLNCRSKHSINSELSESAVGCSSCICTGYKRTEEMPVRADCINRSMPVRKWAPNSQSLVALDSLSNSTENTPNHKVDVARWNPGDLLVDDWEELARQERAKEIAEGIDPPPGFQSQNSQTSPGIQLSDLTLALSQQLTFSIAPYPYLEKLSEAAGFSREFFKLWERHWDGFRVVPAVHTQVDYVHCLVPDLLQITNCSFYWGKMDRYEAERLLDKKAEGTFLLRDSAQEEYLFSVSFRRYGRTLHARIEQWNHKFSFDSHDPGVFASSTVCGLIEHYKDPSCCMFFEPMLTLPLNRSFVFSLQHLCRAVICNYSVYDGINKLRLPRRLKSYLKEYHYKQRVRVRRLDIDQ